MLTEALDNALVALALAGADHVHLIALSEDVSLDDVADVHAGDVLKAELAQGALGSHVGLFKVALGRLVDLLGGNLAEAHLDSLITVALDGLFLHDGAGAGLDDGDGNHLAVGVKQLGHAQLLADDTFLHCFVLL